MKIKVNGPLNGSKVRLLTHKNSDGSYYQEVVKGELIVAENHSSEQSVQDEIEVVYAEDFVCEHEFAKWTNNAPGYNNLLCIHCGEIIDTDY